MTLRRLDATDVGLPVFKPGAPADGVVNLFDLGSHARAREALARGLALDDIGFHVFVVGEDHSGRMSATLGFLAERVKHQPPPPDWVYLGNFQHSFNPRALALPRGQGRRLRSRVEALLPALRDALRKAFEAPDFINDMQRLSAQIGGEVERSFEQLQLLANQHGLALERNEQGIGFTALDEQGRPLPPERVDDAVRARASAALEALREPMRAFNVGAARAGATMAARMAELRRETADHAVAPLVDELEAEFGSAAGLGRWLVELRGDILDHIERFAPHAEPPPPGHRAEDHYSVNLLVDNAHSAHRPVVLEPNPSYQKLFGYVEYRSTGGTLETDFTLIRAGALHRANGGVLVLRADALANEPDAWQALKGALRDRVIRMEDRARSGAPPIAGALTPAEIPLDIKVVIVGAPRWYYTYFAADPDFQLYFKVKADIDADLPASDDDLARYRTLLLQAVAERTGRSCAAPAVEYMLGLAARWAGARDRLTGRFELLLDVLSEAAVIAGDAGCLEAAHVQQAVDDRRRRNARAEDRAQEHIARGTLMIDTDGAVVGQVNGLTVESTGDHAFGRPARVTARTSTGPGGVLNIERVIAMGGPIQQKAVFVLEGFLAGRFAQRFPLSFNASITFEQSYGGVEGDSASLAEVVAIISSLAGLPVRQDIAITGSMNQMGQAQAIGGANEKIEGFFRACEAQGLTGRQGVVVPRANERNLALREGVTAAIAAGRFHIWSVQTVDDAIAHLTGVEVGEAGSDGAYPPDTVYGRVTARLEQNDRALSARHGGAII